MRSMGRVRTWLALGALATCMVMPSVSIGGGRKRECRAACGDAIARCAGDGYRERFCTKEVLALCMRGSSMCGSVTSTTTLPRCVTGVCLGPTGCGVEPDGVTSTVASAEALRRRLLGVWYDCKKASAHAPFGGDAAGIEFTVDGQWFFLDSEGGALVRRSGFGDGGTYDILDTSAMNGPGHFQLNLDINTGFTVILQWSLSTTPQLLLVSNDGVEDALYSHIAGAPGCMEP